MTAHTHTNRLALEKSPYLLQHAHNPVDWYPWGDEAFAEAKRRDVPVMLSVGYATCHWCHVMEKECFEDQEVAALMNDSFVCIKVDREERPDIDQIYMTVAQMMTGRGGWPLNVLLTPDKRPFFVGTYIPKESRQGRLGMLDLVPRIYHSWRTKRQDLENNAEQITQALRQGATSAGEKELGQEALALCYEQMAGRFERTYGGFGGAPKFPTPHNLLFLLRWWSRSREAEPPEMVEKTLQQMRLGGLFDQVGYGFHRYSTDSRWLLPHFEKMLYDQAMLMMAYAEAHQATGKAEYASVAREIGTYVLRDLTSPEGGFYSAEDADSEGEEGKFYVWNEKELREILPEGEADWVMGVFGAEAEGNFHDEATHEKAGVNILHLRKPLTEEEARRWEPLRQSLFAVRERRIRPLLDDKVLTDWNGLMIAAFAKAARALGDPGFTQAARSAEAFVMDRLRRPDGRLWHRWRGGDAGLEAHIDDYAFMAWGLLELYEATFDTDYLSKALELQDMQDRHFWDDAAGGYWFTADDAEALLTRPKEVYDGAVPSGNSVAMLNLLRLARITGDPEREKRAAGVNRAFHNQVHQAVSAFSMMLCAVDFAVGPSCEVVIAGKPGASDTQELMESLFSVYQPRKVVLLRATDREDSDLGKVAPFAARMGEQDGKAAAYVCRDQACEQPTSDPASMRELLDKVQA